MPNNFVDEHNIPGNLVEAESAPIIPGQAAKNIPAPPVPHEMPVFFSGSIAPQLQHDSSFVGTEIGSPRIPKYALMPFGQQASPFTNAATQSTSTIVKTNTTSTGAADTDFYQFIASGGVSGTPRSILNFIGFTVADNGSNNSTDITGQVTLNAPLEFTLLTQTVLLPGPLVLAWANQPPGYEFSVPNGSLGFDGAVATSGIAAGPLALTSAAPSTTTEWALYLGLVVQQNFTTTTLTGWTAMTGNDSNNAFFYRSIPTNGTVSVSQPLSGVACFSGLMLNFSGTAPTIVQSASASDAGTGTMTATFGSPTTAGNYILAVYSCTATSNTPNPAVFTDTQNLTKSQLAYISNPGDAIHFGTGLQVMLLTTATTSAEAITITYPNTNGGTLHVFEINPLSAISVRPRFMPEALTDLSAANVTGRLGVLNGGSGVGTIPNHQLVVGRALNPVATVPTGTANQILTSNGPSADPSFQNFPTLLPVVKINGVGVAIDKHFYMNGVSDVAAVWGVKINGVADGG